MGFDGISMGSLLLIFGICALLFGTKRLKTIGTDLGEALHNFRKSLNSSDTGNKE